VYFSFAVMAYDLDPGSLGTLNYTVTNPLFDAISNPNGSATIVVAG
jgi:hypothetical protein